MLKFTYEFRIQTFVVILINKTDEVLNTASLTIIPRRLVNLSILDGKN